MKKSQTDRAIDQLLAEQKVLQLAIDKLRQTQQQKPIRRPKAVPTPMPEPQEARR